MTVEDIKGLLKNCFYNSRGNHLIADCPFCGHERHFYLNVNKVLIKTEKGYLNCWDCKKCGEKGNLKKLLIKLQKITLLDDGKYSDLYKKINNKLSHEVEGSNLELSIPEIRLPIGFKRLRQDDYLRSRGFTDLEFKKYIIGRTKLIPTLLNYIIVAIEDNKKVKGYISRSVLSKYEIDLLNKQYKRQGLKMKYLRYQNSKNTSFNKLLLGYDEIMFTTEWVILVEGFFDKVRVDQALKLDFSDEIKCCATFGKSISLEQIRRLQNRGVEKVILVQDPDALSETKSYSFALKEEFETVLVGVTSNNDDLGSSSYREVELVFNNLRNPMDFVLSKVDSNKLRR